MNFIFHSKLLLFATALIMTSSQLNAQSMTGTVLTQPCNNNGQIGVTVSGLTPPISYTYNNFQANVSIVHPNINSLTNNASGLSAFQSINWGNPNSWFVSASDGVNSAFISLVLSPAFTDSIKVLNAVCPATSTLEAISFVGGTPPFSVVWTNTTSAINYSANPALVSNGNYSVVITDAAGCQVRSAPSFSGSSIYVTSFSNISFGINGTAANCTNGTASVTGVSGGTSPYTYLWNNSATSSNISGLTQCSYNCIVTDAIGCQTTNYYNVAQAVTISYNHTGTNATCLQNNGSILSFISGGTLPYTFLWSNSATTQNISGLPGGAYYLQITDANGCTGFGSSYIGVNTPISVTYTASASSCTASTGSATITANGGLAPYSVVWNTFPSTSAGISITNKPVGNYFFKITDANGCVQNGIANIPSISTINAAINSGLATCPSTLANVSVSVTGTNGPFTYLWNNATTASSLSNMPTGQYSCIITDAVGCSVTKYGYVSQINNVSVGFNSTPASCLFANDGSLVANAFGGTAPYTYLWSNTQTGPNATALSTGYYYVTVTDANGCQNIFNPNSINQAFVGYNAANNACYCTISGTVFADANNNCVKNFGENGIENIQIHCVGFGYAYTNANGVYSFLVPTGTYTISESMQPFYPLSTCQSNNQVVTVTAAPNCVSTVNFANTVVPIHDLHLVTTSMNLPIPGNGYQQRVILQNEGTLIENTIKIGYSHDGQLTYSNSIPWALTQQNSSTYPNWYSITTGFPILNIGANTTSFINYNVPTNIPINTVINFKDTVASAAPIATNWLTDYTPWNNVNSYASLVVGSYDPNFKEVSPKGTGTQGNISKNDSVLTYVVHFQNTGSYFAQNVVVVDTISTNLNLSSLRPGYSDHNYSATISDNGVVKFTFKNINLPWQSNYGDVLSSGMFVYSVKMKKNLAIGTKIKNTAAIYFDYNEPIITNTTLNTLVAPGSSTTSLQELKSSATNKLLLFPNPARESFTLVFDSPENTNGILTLFDISGREVSSKNISLLVGENSFTESAALLQNGIYLIQLKTSTETITKKLVITK
jgi:uncharacterized repeat protein (TIGR01451 family)